MNEIIMHLNQMYSNEIQINDDTILNTIWFVDDQVLLLHSEDGTQQYKTVWNVNIPSKI